MQKSSRAASRVPAGIDGLLAELFMRSAMKNTTESALTYARIMGFVVSAKPEEAKKFYSETLGLEFLEEHEYSLIFAVNKTLTLRVQKVSAVTPQQFTVFGWQVEDIADAVISLSERGVKFEVLGFPSQDARGICTFENGDKVAWFKDPDGNTLSIAQS